MTDGIPASSSTAGRQFREENRRQHSHRDPDEDGAEHARHRSENHIEDPILPLVRAPDRAGQEVPQSDFRDGRGARRDHIQGDDRHRSDGQAGKHLSLIHISEPTRPY